MVEHLLSWAVLDDGPGMEHGDPVGQGAQHRGVVADEHECHWPRALYLGQRGQDAGGAAGVECADGLVEEQHVRVEYECAGEPDALALAAGELGGIATPKVDGETDGLQRRGGTALTLTSIDAEVRERLSDAGDDALAWVERFAAQLEHELRSPPELAPLGGRQHPRVGTIENHVAGGRSEQERGEPQEGGLAASALTKDAQRPRQGRSPGSRRRRPPPTGAATTAHVPNPAGYPPPISRTSRRLSDHGWAVTCAYAGTCTSIGALRRTVQENAGWPPPLLRQNPTNRATCSRFASQCRTRLARAAPGENRLDQATAARTLAASAASRASS